MSFQKIIESSKQYFPDLQIKYKDKSILMKIIGKLLFFNKKFMTTYTTTIGSTVYFPNEQFVKSHPVSTTVVLLHELVHINDAKKFNKYLFGFLYLTPQILFLLFIPLLFVNWKLSLLCLLFGLPIPSYFRMYFEKRAYIVSLYTTEKLSKRLNFNYNIEEHKNNFLQQFYNSSYYFMWPFKNLTKDFNEAIENIKNGKKPFEDQVFDTLDKIIESY